MKRINVRTTNPISIPFGDIKIYFEDVDIPFDNVKAERPIFVRSGSRIRGMVVRKDEGWAIMFGGDDARGGYHLNLQKCIINGVRHGYEFYVED